MAGDKICCAIYVENGENMMEKDESNLNSESEDEAKDGPENHTCSEFEFSVNYFNLIFGFLKSLKVKFGSFVKLFTIVLVFYLCNFFIKKSCYNSIYFF